MDEMDLVLLIAYGAICFGLGRWYQVQVMVQNILTNTERIRDILNRHLEEDAEAEGPVVAVDAEWINDQVYLYRTDTGEFLAQGADIHTAIANITKLTPGVSYEIPADMAKKPEASQP